MRSILYAKNSLDEFYEKNKDNKILNLPNELFESISKVTPMVNADLLIRNTKGEILLSWRKDKHYKGWHIPGRILRVKESLKECAEKCMNIEIGIDTWFDKKYIDINEVIFKDKGVRCHFISFLFRVYLEDVQLRELNIDKKEGQVGYLKWFKECPKDFLEVQSIYKKYFLK